MFEEIISKPLVCSCLIRASRVLQLFHPLLQLLSSKCSGSMWYTEKYLDNWGSYGLYCAQEQESYHSPWKTVMQLAIILSWSTWFLQELDWWLKQRHNGNIILLPLLLKHGLGYYFVCWVCYPKYLQKYHSMIQYQISELLLYKKSMESTKCTFYTIEANVYPWWKDHNFIVLLFFKKNGGSIG